MRYYIVTIAAIFIALGTGILIGVNLNESDFYLNQQQLLLNDIENKFNQLQQEREDYINEIEGLLNENQKNSSLIDSLYEKIVNKRLEGYNVAIITTNHNYYYGEIKKVLEKAGAKVPIEINYNNNIFNYDDEAVARQFRDFSIYDSKQLIDTLNSRVIDLITFGNEDDLLKQLKDMKIINYSLDLSMVASNPIHYIVLAGGSINSNYEKFQQIDLSLINRCKKNVIPVVGVEAIDVKHSYIPYYQAEEISTVDNVNTKMGKISLIYVISGINGNFGEGEFSKDFVPNFMKEKEGFN
ncbi:copper transporter [Alkaliphilus pronyensis]|nr:copper transporter [Alkaliphilus pronyensis]